MRRYNIALLPGDGIGPEVLVEGVKVLNKIASLDSDLEFIFEYFPWGSEYYLENGKMMPDDALDILKKYDAIYFGAVGLPEVPDWIPAHQLLYKIRRGFNQYVNLRPVKRLQGAPCYLNRDLPIDMVYVRENVEGEYTDIGGRHYTGSSLETVAQVNLFTRTGTERIMRYAFKLAEKRRGKIASITKSNALMHSMVFWDEIFEEVKSDYPDVEARQVLVDAMAMFMVTEPEKFDVLVASNLFGDILTDLGAALQGGLGFAPSGNINPEKEYPSMFEPVHGSSPKDKGKNRVNPIATIWAGKLMLDHLGEQAWGERVLNAIEEVLIDGNVRTPDIGGNSSTQEMGDAIADKLRHIYAKAVG
ncbi:MAG: tartrate dehydrogenase/decarboxylase / D-malate dehydrogenase [Clostridia bacterium]|jgi:tartrate dehydrogenase/decarboxylase/D-malate dehydrogenase|nr:3-isopropylmalate dehydrogenase [Clostridiales bacterium]MDK2985908.1 tartrate dehydrogenase/decarboxylase / D-malate dehydrogenase [Clostridia bacterium]